MTWFPWEFRLASRRTTVLMNRSLFPPHVDETLRRYRVTHLLWGSFESPPDVDPEPWGDHLGRVRIALDLSPNRLMYQSPKALPYPVALYRLGGAAP